MADRDQQRVAEQSRWVERLAAYGADIFGWPPITGRTLGWLLICDPPEQSAAELAAAIQASRASLTGTLRLLTSSGLVESSRRPGGRTIYYRIADDAWTRVLRRRFAALAEFRDIARAGMRLFPPGASEAERLRHVDDLYTWMLAEVEPLWELWDEQYRSRTAPGASD